MTGNKASMFAVTALFDVLLEVVTSVIRQKKKKKEFKDIQIIQEEIKLSLSTNNMIVHVENLKDSTKKIAPSRTNELDKVAEYKINTQKSVVFLYTINVYRKSKLKILHHL